MARDAKAPAYLDDTRSRAKREKKRLFTIHLDGRVGGVDGELMFQGVLTDIDHQKLEAMGWQLIGPKAKARRKKHK